MKLKSVVNKHKATKAFVTLMGKGKSYFSKKTVLEMDLKHDDCFDVLEDEHKPGNFYLRKTASGIKVRKRDLKHGPLFEFSASGITHDFAWKFGVDNKSIKIPVGPKVMFDNIEVFPLITAGLDGFKKDCN